MVRTRADFIGGLSRLWLSPHRVQRACRNAHKPTNARAGPGAAASSENGVAWARRAWRFIIALAAGVGVAGAAIGALAQPGGAPPAEFPAQPPPRIRPENLEPAKPSAADALQVFEAIEDYLVAGSPAETTPGGDAPWRSVSGVCLTLLIDGKVLARSNAMHQWSGALVPDPAARAKVGADAARTLWADLRAKFPPAAAVETPEARRELLSSLVLSVELAGEHTPLLIDELAEADFEAAPGLDGVGATTAHGVGAWMFPVQQLALALTPADALGACVSKATGEAALSVVPARTLRIERGVTLVKFPVVHAVRTSPAGAPALLYRGHEPVDLSRITYAELVASAGRLAAHLRSRLDTPQRAAGLGVYTPVMGTSTPAGDPDLAMQLTLFALLDHAAATGADGADLVALWRASTDGGRVKSPVALAGAIVAGERALALTPDPAASTSIRARIAELAGRLESAFDADTGFAKGIAPAARGLVACALVRAAEARGRDERAPAIARAQAGVRRVFVDTPPGDLVAQMPWLGWAAADLADLEGANEIAAAPALRTMRERIWEHQLTPTDAGADGLDLVGGVVFSKGVAALPGAATARPLAFLATAIGDDRLTTPRERPGELARVLGALRFIRQLQADESTAWMYADRAGALGGVRAAPWDHKMTAEASVYALLAYTRTIASLDAQVRASGAKTPGK